MITVCQHSLVCHFSHRPLVHPSWTVDVDGVAVPGLGRRLQRRAGRAHPGREPIAPGRPRGCGHVPVDSAAALMAPSCGQIHRPWLFRPRPWAGQAGASPLVWKVAGQQRDAQPAAGRRHFCCCPAAWAVGTRLTGPCWSNPSKGPDRGRSSKPGRAQPRFHDQSPWLRRMKPGPSKSQSTHGGGGGGL
jgi:hypothetical protein